MTLSVPIERTLGGASDLVCPFREGSEDAFEGGMGRPNEEKRSDVTHVGVGVVEQVSQRFKCAATARLEFVFNKQASAHHAVCFSDVADSLPALDILDIPTDKLSVAQS